MKWATLTLVSSCIGLGTVSSTALASNLTFNNELQTDLQSEPQTPENSFMTSTVWDSIKNFETPQDLALAAMVPSFKVALKKGMYEFQVGLGHESQSIVTNRGETLSQGKSPQVEYIPYQVAYGLGASTNIALSGEFTRTSDSILKSNAEGPVEPELAINQYFKSKNAAIHLNAGYRPDLGARTNTFYANSRAEGNNLAGGASYQFSGGVFTRYGMAILGGEASYLFKDERVRNETLVGLYNQQTIKEEKIRLQGGHEKTLRVIAEVAFPIRFGLGLGRTWIEDEEEQRQTDTAYKVYSGYGKNFAQIWGRFQFNRNLSLLPEATYTVSDSVSSITGTKDEFVRGKVSLRYRF